MGKNANLAIALYINALRVNPSSVYHSAQSDEQRACFAILKEWVRQHIREKPEMYLFSDHMTEVEGRGYMFEFRLVDWGNENDRFYLLVQRTLKEMADAFNCEEHSNCSTPYALEYSWVRGNGMEYGTTRLGAYAYAVGVKIEVETAADFFIAEEM